MAEKKTAQVAKAVVTDKKATASPKAKAPEAEKIEAKTTKKASETAKVKEDTKKAPTAKKATSKTASKTVESKKSEKTTKATTTKKAAPKATSKTVEPQKKSATTKKAAPKVTSKTADTKKSEKTTKSTTAKKSETKSTTVKKSESKSTAKTVAKTKSKKQVKTLDLNRYRLKKLYIEKAVPALIKKFNYKNVNQVPKIEKVVLNMGLGDIKDNSKSFQIAVEELKLIAGQKPIITVAKKSVANFKVRKGMNIGAKVTLRGERMYDFVDKFVNIVLPRVRDFRGVSNKSFDGRGNFAIGVKEQLIFPEISYDQIEKVRGLDVCFVTTAKTDEEAKELLLQLGMPFAR